MDFFLHAPIERVHSKRTVFVTCTGNPFHQAIEPILIDQSTARVFIESFTIPHQFPNITSRSLLLEVENVVHQYDLVDGFYSVRTFVHHLNSIQGTIRFGYESEQNRLVLTNLVQSHVVVRFDLPQSIGSLLQEVGPVLVPVGQMYRTRSVNLLTLTHLKIRIKELTSPFYHGQHRDDSTVLCLPITERFTDLICYKESHNRACSFTRDSLYSLNIVLTDQDDRVLAIREPFQMVLRVELIPDESFVTRTKKYRESLLKRTIVEYDSDDPSNCGPKPID
jgi:hypothetical protein